MSLKGTGEGSVGGRVEKLGLEKEGFAYHAYPVTFWDVFGEKGLPLRTTITEMGPLLLSRILNLNDTQSDILHAGSRFYRYRLHLQSVRGGLPSSDRYRPFPLLISQYKAFVPDTSSIPFLLILVSYIRNEPVSVFLKPGL